MFADFAENPVASGSIAQIHKAHLSASGAQNSDYPPGTTVAVKVLYLSTFCAVLHCSVLSRAMSCPRCCQLLQSSQFLLRGTVLEHVGPTTAVCSYNP